MGAYLLELILDPFFGICKLGLLLSCYPKPSRVLPVSSFPLFLLSLFLHLEPLLVLPFILLRRVNFLYLELGLALRQHKIYSAIAQVSRIPECAE